LQTLQSQNATLAQTLVEQDAEIARLLETLDRAVKDLDGAVEGLNEEVASVAKEITDTEIQMSTS
jgi:phage shock protein A